MGEDTRSKRWLDAEDPDHPSVPIRIVVAEAPAQPVNRVAQHRDLICQLHQTGLE